MSFTEWVSRVPSAFAPVVFVVATCMVLNWLDNRRRRREEAE